MIKNESNNLLVDLGIHKHSLLPTGVSRKQVYDSILGELAKIDNQLDVLVTHFHEDHIHGLVYLAQSSPRKRTFQNLYIPDIFSGEVAKSALTLTLLEELLRGYYINESKFNLCQFCQMICGSVSSVHLLKRGDHFLQYTTLWPDVDFLKSKYEKIVQTLSLEQKAYYSELTRIAKDLSSIVLSLTVDAKQNTNSQDTFLGDIQRLEKELNALQKTITFTRREKSIIHTSNFGNWCSIVFHNSQNSEANLLFTGDVVKSHMRQIKKGLDIALHNKYRYIKIPHHGTKSHYCDFTGYSPDIYMIPNGKCSTAGKISEKYVASLSSARPFMYCSNCNACESWSIVYKCACLPQREIIYRSSGKSIGKDLL